MRGGYHHTGYGSLGADGVAEFGGGTDVIEQEHMQAVGAEHIGRDARELLAVVAAVKRDADAEVIALYMRTDIIGESLGGHAHGVFVHAVRADSHDAAQAAGTEFQIPVKRILKPGGVLVTQFQYLHFGFGIKIPFHPFFCDFLVIHIVVLLISTIGKYNHFF